MLYLSERSAWRNMKYRCYKPTDKSYKYYGARGIIVCQRWQDNFWNFLNDVGPKPSPKYSIHRIDNDGNYEPGDCKWATAKEQAFNKQKNQNARTNKVWFAPNKVLDRQLAAERRHLTAIRRAEQLAKWRDKRMERIERNQSLLAQWKNENLYKLARQGTR